MQNRINKLENAKKLANWVSGELVKNMRDRSLDIQSLKIEPAALVELLFFLDKGEISIVTAKQILGRMFDTGEMPKGIIKEQSLTQVQDKEEIKKEIIKVLRENKKAAEDFAAGKEASLGFLVGQVMRNTQGRANPKLVAELLKEELSDGN